MEKAIETERLYLKAFEKDDFEAAKKFWGDPEVMDQSGGATPHNLLSQILKSYRSLQKQPKHALNWLKKPEM